MPISSATRILDRRRLASALLKRINEGFGGNLSAAARDAGLEQPTLYHHANPTPATAGSGKRLAYGNVSPAVAEGLALLLSPEDRREIFRAPGAVYGLFLYSEWLASATDRAGTKGLPHEKFAWDESPDGPWIDRATEFRVLLNRIRNDAPHVANQIEKVAFRLPNIDSQCRKALKTLGIQYEPDRSKKVRYPIIPARFLLSLYRMLEPLLDSAASGWIELRHDELTRARFRQFIEAGWKREMVLLGRASDSRRLDRLKLPIAENDPRLGSVKAILGSKLRPFSAGSG